MQKQFKLIILANTVFVLLFFFFNWLEYEVLNVGSELILQAHFPLFISGSTIPAPMVTGFIIIILPNYLLAIFLLSTIANLYFVFRLQRSNKTKQNAS